MSIEAKKIADKAISKLNKKITDETRCARCARMFCSICNRVVLSAFHL